MKFIILLMGLVTLIICGLAHIMDIILSDSNTFPLILYIVMPIFIMILGIIADIISNIIIKRL